ncbi:MAG: hypothetical protein ACXVW9_18555 [Nocardioidaceae bacterium]
MRTTSRTTRRRGSGILIVLVAVVAVVVGVGLLFYRGVGPLPNPEGCRANVGGLEADLSTEQAQNAALIAAVGLRRGLPARAVSIALATAYQESKLRNLDHGDRDSVGLFQQRPSMGWGTAKQISDPYYATNKFYDALQRVAGYQSMRITVAAQRVQRSGFPEAYAEHEPDARAVASALTGYSPHAFTCVVHGTNPVRQPVRADGLTGRAQTVRNDLEAAFGPGALGRVTAGPRRYAGRAVEVSFPSTGAASSRRGWAVAQYLVAQSRRLSIEHVVYDRRIWTSGSASEQGWQRYRSGDRSRHRVQVDVVAGG